ncbi:MAG: transcriptional repressor [Solirubrobacterales bacterium]|nr:transcriptional repressor [Solirubrobacterales bacterium]MCB8915726.1 transcriptional repressor [Thermoleophilales bacterium]
MNEPANWSEHSARQITAAGLRRSTPRQRVIDLLADRDCAVTALEIDAELEGVGRATVYRAIEQLEDLGLVRKVDLGSSAHGYEKIEPSGHHHHHIVCDDCGKVEPFEDEALEEAIHDIHRKGFRLESHEVTLHGHCADCS